MNRRSFLRSAALAPVAAAGVVVAPAAVEATRRPGTRYIGTPYYSCDILEPHCTWAEAEKSAAASLQRAAERRGGRLAALIGFERGWDIGYGKRTLLATGRIVPL